VLVPTAAAAEDKCPQSPDFSGPCPVLHFAPTYKVFKRTVQVKVKTSIEARVAVSGLHSAGLWTIVQPAANAGAIFHVDNMNGVFHGVMIATGPIGCRAV